MELGSAHTIITQRQSSSCGGDIEMYRYWAIEQIYWAHSWLFLPGQSSQMTRANTDIILLYCRAFIFHLHVPQLRSQDSYESSSMLTSISLKSCCYGRSWWPRWHTGLWHWLLTLKVWKSQWQSTNILDLLGVMFRRAKQQNNSIRKYQRHKLRNCNIYRTLKLYCKVKLNSLDVYCVCWMIVIGGVVQQSCNNNRAELKTANCVAWWLVTGACVETRGGV